MIMKKIFSIVAVAFCFCALTTTFISCGDDKGDDPTPPPAPAPAAVTKADLIGAWDVWANGAPFTYTFTDSKLTIKQTFQGQEQTLFDGAYTLENGRLSYVFNNENTSMDLEMIHNKTVMLAISIIPASQSYSGEEERQTSFAYRQGAQIPVTKADVQGKWYWESKAGFHGIRAVLKLEGDNFDLIITPWGERHTGTFTYQNGYLHFTTLHSYSSRYDNEEHMNGENPEATVWRDYDDPSVNSGSGVVPDPIDAFIPNGTAAYSTLANLQVEYTKK